MPQIDRRTFTIDHQHRRLPTARNGRRVPRAELHTRRHQWVWQPEGDFAPVRRHASGESKHVHHNTRVHRLTVAVAVNRFQFTRARSAADRPQH